MNGTYEATYARYCGVIERQLALELTEAIPSPVLDAMRYSLLAPGKRLRPVLLLAAADMIGVPFVEAAPVACALEMIHAYSLIHDDLPCMDDDDLRRGRPTNHKVYGEGMAVLAGDGLLNLAYEVLLRETLANPAKLLHYAAAADTIARAAGATGMVGGQCVDIVSERDRTGDADTLLYIHTHKTADMLRASVVAGLHLGGATHEQLSAGQAFGEAMGIAFQIVDDLLDVEGDVALLGKQTGMDAAHGKLTWPGLHGLEETRAAAANYSGKALDALAVFGERAAFFRELVTRMCERRS